MVNPGLVFGEEPFEVLFRFHMGRRVQNPHLILIFFLGYKVRRCSKPRLKDAERAE
jgi:hypothetical protein